MGHTSNEEERQRAEDNKSDNRNDKRKPLLLICFLLLLLTIGLSLLCRSSLQLQHYYQHHHYEGLRHRGERPDGKHSREEALGEEEQRRELGRRRGRSLGGFEATASEAAARCFRGSDGQGGRVPERE